MNQFVLAANGNGTNAASTITVNLGGASTLNLSGTNPIFNMGPLNAATLAFNGDISVVAGTTFNSVTSTAATITGLVTIGANNLTITGTPDGSGNYTFAGGAITGARRPPAA